MSAFPNVIQSLDPVGNVSGTEIGAQRTLNGVFHETLKSFDGDARKLTYSIDDGPGPLEGDNCQGYVGTIQVYPVTSTNGTFVMWTSKWEVGDQAVADYCNPVYQALLSDLKNSME